MYVDSGKELNLRYQQRYMNKCNKHTPTLQFKATVHQMINLQEKKKIVENCHKLGINVYNALKLTN